MGPVTAVSYCTNPSYSHILAASVEAGKVHLLDTLSQSVLCTMAVHNNIIFDLKFLPGETLFVTVRTIPLLCACLLADSDSTLPQASGDRSCEVVDAVRSVSVATLGGHQGSVRCVNTCASDKSAFYIHFTIPAETDLFPIPC